MPLYLDTVPERYAVSMPVFCTAPASASTVTTGATPVPPPAVVTNEGTFIVMPCAGKTPWLQASMVGVPNRVLLTNSLRYCVGLNAGLVEKLSSAAVTYRRDSSLPSAALILCSVYAPIDVIGVRTVWLFSAEGRIILRAASTTGVAASSALSSVGFSGAVVTAASLSVSVGWVCISSVSLSLAEILCTAALENAALSTSDTSRKDAAVTRR